ncbi:MAG: aminopeptidase P family protein [Saprospiraceae bacterium]
MLFSNQTYTDRRTALQQQLSSGLLLFMGNNNVGMNYAANTYHFRQDSTFLYFFGIDRAGLAATIDLDKQQVTIYGDEHTMEDVVWEGAHPSLRDLAAQVGVAKVQPTADLAKAIEKAKASDQPIHYLPPYRDDNKIKLHTWLEIPFSELKTRASVPFIKAVVKLRSIKSSEEIAEMERALGVTRAMHHAAMSATKAGKTEAEITGIARGISVSFEGDLAYPIILSKDGQTLHNHSHANRLASGQLVLADMGAATKHHYASDITRTWPVDPKFTQQQREIYEIVLKAEVDSIHACRPGVAYRDVHLGAARIIMNGLKDLGIMKGDTETAVNEGAHALFFPHGLGHHIGLDVHDMEDLGENYVGYSDTIKRSELFGTAYLRLGRELETGFVITVEPGIYFIPQLIDQWQAAGKFSQYINYDKLAAYRNFGGIRIEDNILITEGGQQILGKKIAKSVEEIEGMRQSC